MRHRSLALCAALALTLPSLTASAQGTVTAAAQTEAASRFKKGLELFKDGDYQAALIELRRANELAPNYNVLYNIGQVYFQLQDYPNALHSLERYVQEGGKGIDAKRRAEVEKDIDKLKARVANVEIVVNVPDAEVTIDDVSAGKTPLPKAVLVSAGRHRIVVTKVGFTSITRQIEIASAELQKVPVDLVETKANSPTPVVVPDPGNGTTPPPPVPTVPTPLTLPEGPAPQPTRSVPVVGWVVTGGLAAGAVVTGILALGASSDLKTQRTSPAPTRDALDSAKSKTQTLALVTDILAGCAVVAGGITLYFTVAGGSSSSDAKPASAPPPAGAFSVPTLKVGVNPTGVSLLGTF
ncbi:MAG: PEGA domain-containing protein [Byssovorax sp.]